MSAPAGPGRGGYPHQGGRGRGYSQSGYQGQMPYSPGPNFRSTPNQPRAGPNMGPQFHGPNAGRPLAPFPNSPHQASRSPALANAHPATPQMNQVPMAAPQMPPQPFNAYGQHMAPNTVRFHPASVNPNSRRGFSKRRSQGPRVFSAPSLASASTSPHTPPLPPPNLAPESGQFEEYLTLMKHNPQAYANGFDPTYGYYAPAYGMNQVGFMPPSPQPRPGMPFNPQAPYMQNQFPPQPPAQAAPLSRTPSQVSNTERPNSSLGQPQPPAGPPGPTHSHNTSRPSNSPAPKPHFVIPTKKSPIVIKDPGSGVVKNFEKGPGSPTRGTPSPVKMATPTSTPPPRSNNGASEHQRSDSKATKTDDEKKKELREAVRQKIEQDEAEQRRQADAEQAGDKKEGDAAAEKKTEDKEATKQKAAADEEAARKGVEDLNLKDNKAEEAKPAAAEEPKKGPLPPADDDDIDFDAIEREMAEIEAKEAAAEADYNAKKQQKKEEEERKEKEDFAAYEANMKNAEREAEAREEAAEKKRQAGAETDMASFESLKKGGFPAAASSTPADSGATTPASDTSMAPPGKPASAAKQKPAALKLETSKAVEPPQPSAALKALQAARFVEDLAKISYPSSVASPNPALNANAPADRKFHYNKEFLLQFQSVFKEKPSVDWDARVRETVGDSESSRPQSARTPMMGSRNPSRQGFPQPFGGMGSFGQPPSSRHSLPPGSTERIALANATRTASMANPFGQFGRPGLGMNNPLSRTNSSSNMHGGMPGSPRVGSSNRSGTRTGSKRDKNQAKKEEEMAKTMPLTAGQELKGLQVSSTGWKPRSVGQAAAGPTPGAAGHMPPDMVQRKVKAALNKMTPENFERIAGQILEIVSQSKAESDGRTLRQVIQLTFEKATDEAHWASIYAKFCKRMLESMSPEIQDENIRDKTGAVVTGGSLFRKYLLNRCQEEFERGWKVNLPPKPEGQTEEAAMMSDEYYAAAAAKRRGLGLVKFIGELYKLGMLTERIMHECVKKLVDYEGVPDEAEVESLTSLLRTIGASLDASERGHTLMDVYFARIAMVVEAHDLPSRMRFMLMVSHIFPRLLVEEYRFSDNFTGHHRFEKEQLDVQGCRQGPQDHSRNSGRGMLRYAKLTTIMQY